MATGADVARGSSTPPFSLATDTSDFFDRAFWPEKELLEQAEQAIINPINNNFAERLIGSSRTELKLKVTELIRA
jgi:hypothetical protein